MSRLKSVGFCFCLALISCCLVIVRSQTQQSLTLLSNVNIAYTYGSTSTQFIITSPLGNGISVTNAWLGIGFNSQTKMVIQSIEFTSELDFDLIIEFIFRVAQA